MHVYPVEGLRWMSVDDGAVLFSPVAGGFADLDRSGAELWHALVEGQWRLAAVVDHLHVTHQLDTTDAAAVVGGFIEELVRLGMVTARP